MLRDSSPESLRVSQAAGHSHRTAMEHHSKQDHETRHSRAAPKYAVKAFEHGQEACQKSTNHIGLTKSDASPT